MAIIVIPTRIIPGCLLGCLFAAIGMMEGLTATRLVVQHEFLPILLIATAAFAFALWFIVRVCRQKRGTAETSAVTSLSPAVLAGILIVSLLTGLVTGSVAAAMLIP